MMLNEATARKAAQIQLQFINLVRFIPTGSSQWWQWERCGPDIDSVSVKAGTSGCNRQDKPVAHEAKRIHPSERQEKDETKGEEETEGEEGEQRQGTCGVHSCGNLNGHEDSLVSKWCCRGGDRSIPQVGLPSHSRPTSNSRVLPKSFEIWPTSLVGGERPGGGAANQCECGGV